MNRTEQDHVLTVARDALLAVLPDAWAIYVFGSFARGEEGLGSDIDLAVLHEPQGCVHRS